MSADSWWSLQVGRAWVFEPLGCDPGGSLFWWSALFGQPAFDRLPRPAKQPPRLHGLGELATFGQFSNVLGGAAHVGRYLLCSNEGGGRIEGGVGSLHLMNLLKKRASWWARLPAEVLYVRVFPERDITGPEKPWAAQMTRLLARFSSPQALD